MIDPTQETIVKLFMDGNAWCALIGVNIQEGVCAFGDSPSKSLENLSKVIVLAAQDETENEARALLEEKNRQCNVSLLPPLKPGYPDL